MKHDERLGLAGMSILAPGFAPAVTGRYVAAAIWAGLGLAPCLLGMLSVWALFAAAAVRLAAPLASFIHTHRRDRSSTWWNTWPTAVLLLGLGGLGILGMAIEMFRIPSSSMHPNVQIGDRVVIEKVSFKLRDPERGEIVVFDHPCSGIPYIKRIIAKGGDTVEVRCSVVYVNGKALRDELVRERDEYQDRDDVRQVWIPRAVSRYREHHGDRTYEVFHDVDRPADVKRGVPAVFHDFPDLDKRIAPSCTQGDFYDRPPNSKQPLGTLATSTPSADQCAPQLHFVLPPNTYFMMGDNRDNANDSRYWGLVRRGAIQGRLIGVLNRF